MKFHTLSLALLLASSTLLFSCTEEEKVTAQEKPIKVRLHKTSSSDQIGFATASGKLIAKQSVNISTRMMGHITYLRAEVGDYVRAGQSLASISSADIQAKSGQASAQIAQAQASYNLAAKDYQRFKNLYENQSASRKELDEMQARFEMAKAGLQAASMMKNEVNANSRYLNVTSPISGVVTAKYVSQGDLASPGMPILTIESSGNLQAQVLLPEDEITLIKPGMPVKVEVKSTGTQVGGTVGEVGLSSTSTGGQYMVKINVAQNKDLLPGMYVSAEFPFKRSSKTTQDFQETVVVPKSALVTQGQLTGIYTVSKQKTAVLRWVRTGATFGEQIEILSGLRQGEPYVTGSSSRLYNGAKVTY